jgi:succinoglycan biosynthesis transport protein ExoP
MSVFQFLRIIWAHRWLTLATTIATVIGAFIALLIVPPSYEATTKVMLNTLKPDPVTGEILPNAQSRTYVATQMELIKDYGVAGQAVDALGWPNNPTFIQQYQQSPNHEVIDIRRWLAQRIIDRTEVGLVPGTNILEIVFKSSSPNEAKAMADALRNAYLDSALQTHREDATKTADWYTQQAAKEQAALNAADDAKTAYETTGMSTRRGSGRFRARAPGRAPCSRRWRPRRRPPSNWRRSTPRSVRLRRTSAPTTPKWWR